MTAAAAILNLNTPADRSYLARTTQGSSESSKASWKFYENIGEIQYSVGRSARVAGYAEFVVQRLNDDGIWEPVTDGPIGEIASTLYSPYNGTRGFIERYYGLMKVPAAAVLIRVVEDGEFIGYQFLSTDEIDSQSTDPGPARGREAGIRWVMTPTGSGIGEDDRLVRDVEPKDVLGRVWKPSLRWVELPASPLMAMKTEAQILIDLTRSLRSRIKSRFVLAGILTLPSTIGEARVAGRRIGAANVSTLDYINEAINANIDSSELAEAIAPILLMLPPDDAEALRHITVDRIIDQTDLTLRSDMIQRLLFGMDEPQSSSKGVEEQTHWGTWNATDEERRIGVQPELETLDWALTQLVLNREMREMGAGDEEIIRHRIWHNLDRAAVRTNAQEDVRQAHDRLVANTAALARRTGLEVDEVLDPDHDEYVRQVGLKTANARLALWGTKHKIPDEYFESDKQPGPAETRPGDKPKAGPGVGDPGSPNPQDRRAEGPRRMRPA